MWEFLACRWLSSTGTQAPPTLLFCHPQSVTTAQMVPAMPSWKQEGHALILLRA